jgi:hypothetical protein
MDWIELEKDNEGIKTEEESQGDRPTARRIDIDRKGRKVRERGRMREGEPFKHRQSHTMSGRGRMGKHICDTVSIVQAVRLNSLLSYNCNEQDEQIAYGATMHSSGLVRELTEAPLRRSAATVDAMTIYKSKQAYRSERERDRGRQR